MITRESLALKQDLVSLLRRPVKARHEEVQVRSERFHGRDFALQRTNHRS